LADDRGANDGQLWVDGSGDVIIDLPPNALATINVGLGDLLPIELVEGSIVLKPIRDSDTNS